ncbi:MAG: DinB family protein [Bacteroidetes bacterium]|jgi:hypothetical protein|nr:DinB family protein [Bacteroidota bacterium]
MPLIETIPEYFKPYVNKVSAVTAYSALEEKWEEMRKTFVSMSDEKSNFSYEEGKWTPKQIVQHLIDTERVLSQRALRFARKDMTQLPGYDHNNYVEVADVSDRTIVDLWDEFHAVRISTLFMYKSFKEAELKREGFANGLVLSVENQGFIISGHALHHTQIVRERYLV